MEITANHFQQIRNNFTYDYDVFLETFGVKAKTPFFEFEAFYEEKDIVKNQHVISLSKVQYGFCSEVLEQTPKLTEEQKKEVVQWLKDLYEGEYAEAKESWLQEKEREANAPLFDHEYNREMDLVTSDWYN